MQFDNTSIHELEDRLQGNSSEFVYIDDTEEIAKHLPTGTSHKTTMDGIAMAFKSIFDRFLAYHCCRPVAVGSYYVRGVNVLDKRDAVEEFKNWLAKEHRAMKIDDSHFENAFAEMEPYSAMRQGHLYYVLDHRYMSEHCRHYFESGGEYVQGIARQVDRDAKCSTFDLLQNRGKPTVFQLVMPTSKLNSECMQDLSRHILGTWAYNTAHRTGNSVLIDFAVTDDEAVPAEQVLTHFAPSPTGTYVG